MTFETETYLTLEEYKKLSRRVMFKKKAVWLLLAAAIITTYQLILHWTGIYTGLDSIGQSLDLIVSFVGILVLMTAFYIPQKHYNSSKMISKKVLYSFDEEKIGYTLAGAGGYFAWEYINRYVQIDNFLLLYTSDIYTNRVIVKGLNSAQIGFVKSKIKMPLNGKQVRPIR